MNKLKWFFLLVAFSSCNVLKINTLDEINYNYSNNYSQLKGIVSVGYAIVNYKFNFVASVNDSFVKISLIKVIKIAEFKAYKNYVIVSKLDGFSMSHEKMSYEQLKVLSGEQFSFNDILNVFKVSTVDEPTFEMYKFKKTKNIFKISNDTYVEKKYQNKILHSILVNNKAGKALFQVNEIN